MASIFKQQYTATDAKGRKVTKKSAHWYIDYKGTDGVRKRVRGFKDKTATAQLAAKLEKEAELAEVGIVDRHKEHRNRPLRGHLDDFKASLLAKGNTRKHAGVVFTRAKAVMEGCGYSFIGEVSASKVHQFLADLRGDGASIRTSNGYLQASKQFFRWLVSDNRTSENPLAHLQGLNAKLDVRRKRRSLEPDEIRYLLEVTRAAKTRFKMDGYERSLVYRFAFETGLRANELRTLKVSSFDFDHNTVTVVAGYSKHRREDVLSMRPDMAKLLRGFFRAKVPAALAFSIPSRTADMLRADLDEARQQWLREAGDSPVEYKRRQDSSFLLAESPEGIVDFHSSRHTTGSLLAAAGVHPKTAQEIMRHSDINLTMLRYTHVLRGQTQSALEQLPDLSLPSIEAQQARGTGTDDHSAAGEGAYKPAYKKLTETPDSGGQGLSSAGNEQKNHTDCEDDSKSLSVGGVRRILSFAVTG